MYVKLFSSLYQGTLRGKTNEILVFTNLLAHADQCGIVDKHWRAIAEETGLSKEQVQEAILSLEAPDPESRSPEENGSRIVRMDGHRAWGWQIVNYVKYRSIRSEEDRREQNKIAQAKWRAKNKPSSADVSQDKPPSAQAEAYTEEEVKKEKKSRSGAPVRPDDVTERTWEDWLQLRKTKRAPVTETVLAEARKESAKANLSLERFLATWCARGSQGLQAEWLKPEERGPKFANSLPDPKPMNPSEMYS